MPPENHPELRDLYERYARVVHRRALQLLGSESDAWDVVQNVFIQVFRAPEAFRGESRPMTYLYRIATNLCLNLIRARQARTHASAGADLRPAHLAPDAQAEARDLLFALSRKLDDRKLTIAALHFGFGMLQEEIAEVVGLSRKTVGKELGLVRAMAESLRLEPALGKGGGHG